MKCYRRNNRARISQKIKNISVVVVQSRSSSALTFDKSYQPKRCYCRPLPINLRTRIGREKTALAMLWLRGQVICVFVCVCVCVCERERQRKRECVYLCACVCMYIHICTYIQCTCTHTYIYIYFNMYIYNIYIHIHMKMST